MKRLAVACLLLVALPACAAPPSEASIDRLIQVTDLERTFATSQRMSEGMMRSMAERQVHGRQMTQEQRQRMDAAMERTMATVRDEMSFAKTRPYLVRIYTETFTQEEVDGLIAFYDSPSGRAFIAKMPVVMQKSMQVMQERMAPLMRRLEAELRETAQSAPPAAPYPAYPPAQPPAQPR